jgi:uncharacterized protein (DUF1330 family)
MGDLASASGYSAEAWIASWRASAISLVLISFACAPPAMARGGHIHGVGGSGLHDHREVALGPRGEKRTPAYVLITVSKITDAEPFRNAIQALTDAATPSAGRLVVDLDKPVAWDGTAAEHVVMIEFESGDQAQAWKSSDAFKSFDAELHRTSNSTMQLVQGLPTPAGRALGGGRRGRGLDQKAFEPNVKEYDLMLNKMHGICKGC